MNHDTSATQKQTQTARAVMTLRDLIVRDRLDPEERYTETQLAELLSMSRTPIRAALQTLTDEGLLSPVPGGGYVLRQFSPGEISQAIELRGMLEGYCARLLAERGLDAGRLAALAAISDAIAVLLANRHFGQADLAQYERLNARLHQGLVAATDSPLLMHEIERANARPFASASALVGMYDGDDEARQHLLIGQDHHRILIEAIRDRQGARAEAIMREHARLSQHNLLQACGRDGALDRLRGASLIRQPEEQPG